MAGEHDEIYRRLSRIETTIASQTAEIQRLREDVAELLRVVVRGNGHSLVTRLSILERDVEAQGRKLAGLQAGAAALAQEGVRGRWSAIVAGIAAGGAVVGSVITHVIRVMLGGGGQ